MFPQMELDWEKNIHLPIDHTEWESSYNETNKDKDDDDEDDDDDDESNNDERTTTTPKQ